MGLGAELSVKAREFKINQCDSELESPKLFAYFLVTKSRA